MKKINPTKERLLRTASVIFSQKGFQDTTIAEISEAAEANIAAVNYHFGDKEKLYDAVWRYAFEISLETYSVQNLLPNEPKIEDYLYAHIHSVLSGIFSEEKAGLFHKLLSREIAAPTLALEKIMKDALHPQKEHLKAAVIEYLGESVDPMTVESCMRSISSNFVFFNINRRIRKRMFGKEKLEPKDIESLSQHILTFSMGGLRAIKESL